MIDKIDTDEIRIKTKVIHNGYGTQIKPSVYEKACIDKINELVDKFNEVFPL